MNLVSESSPSVASLIKDIAKKSNLRIGTFSDVVRPVQATSTGNIAVDYVSAVGGIPLGRITELYGLPSSGKSTTALQAAARLQQDIITSGREEYILYLDYEHALDLNYSKALGLDVEHPSFLLVQPAWLEEGAEVALKLIPTGQVRMSIWDSVAAMTPASIEDGSFDQRTSAMNRARLLAGLLRLLNAMLSETASCAVFLNHLMEEVAMVGGRPGLPPKVTSSGGKALKYYASLRLEYRQIKTIKGKVWDALHDAYVERPLSTQVKVKAVKNKVGVPFREAEIRIRYGQGFDELWSALQVLVAYGNIKLSSGYYYMNDQTLAAADMDQTSIGRFYVRGEENILSYADAHPAWRWKAIAMARELVIQPAEVQAAIHPEPLSGDELTSLTTGGDIDWQVEDEPSVQPPHRSALNDLLVSVEEDSASDDVAPAPARVASKPSKVITDPDELAGLLITTDPQA